MNSPCVRTLIAVRRVQRHPLTKKTLRTGNFIQKQVIRGATLGVIPSGLNDVIFHHANFTVDEAIHIVVDQATVSSMSGLIALTFVLSKYYFD
jgi:hypothetical protein